MTKKTNLIRAFGIAAVATVLTASGAFAAVATSTANLRAGPGGPIVGTLHAGTNVGITDHAGPWCEISKPGRDGWVRCAILADARIDRFHRFDRHDRFDRFDRRPGVEFSFSGGGVGVHLSPPRHPFMW